MTALALGRARARQLARRKTVGARRRVRARVRPEVRPELGVPLGAKLEVTHRCNLRCDFCYTDSPRRTLERPTELDDQQWSAVLDRVLALDVLEAVVTGGEPLLRRELTLSLVDRLGAAGVSTMLNTNGWHVDDEVADRLATVPGLRVHISVDGATPAAHDASRGVPGGWRRAMEAIDRLTSRGVDVVVVHVLLPGGEDEVEPLLWQLWALGVTAVRLTPISPSGAGRDRTWYADLARIRAVVAAVAPPLMRADVLVELDDRELSAPRAAFLVRPNGDVVPDSIRPHVFGHALEDDLAEVWERLAAAGGSAGEVPAGHNAYADPDVRLDGRAPVARPQGEAAAKVERLLADARAKKPTAAGADPERAAAYVEELVLRRRHGLGAVRRSRGTLDGEHVRVTGSRHVHRLNATASLVLDAATTGTLDEAVAALAGRHPSVPRPTLVHDVVHAARDLRQRGIIVPVAPTA